MTGERKSMEKEPTIRDVSDKLDFVLETMNARFLISDKRFIALNNRMDGIDARLGSLERDVGKIKGITLDIQDDLTASLAAIDKDSITLIDHEDRITKLEAA